MYNSTQLSRHCLMNRYPEESQDQIVSCFPDRFVQIEGDNYGG